METPECRATLSFTQSAEKALGRESCCRGSYPASHPLCLHGVGDSQALEECGYLVPHTLGPDFVGTGRDRTQTEGRADTGHMSSMVCSALQVRWQGHGGSHHRIIA